MKKNSKFETQLSRISCLSCVFALGLPYITFLFIFHFWYCSTVAGAVEAEERPVYIINTGDQLLITVVGYEKELTALVVVRPDGMLTYPVVGDVVAAGLTIAELSSAISDELSALDYYENPQVTVQLSRPRQETICVFGDVEEPGRRAFPESASVIEVLGAAGGLKDTADLSRARIIKGRTEIIPIDLEALLKKDIIDQGVISDEWLADRFMLEDGDILIVPSAIKTERVNVIGHVNNPGHYRVKSDMDLIEALALAGGPLEPDADLRRVRIVKADGSVVIADATRAWTEGDGKQNSPNPVSRQTENVENPLHLEMVQPGDSVVVLEKGKLNVLGSVKTQGKFSVDGEISIIEALTLAGIEKDANLEKLRIVRSTGERVTVNASKIWDEQTQEAEVKLGEGDTLIVPKSWQIDWAAISTIVLTVGTLYGIFK